MFVGGACSFLYDHRQLLGGLGQKTAQQLGWADIKVITVRPDTTAVEALALMAEKGIAGVAVVSENEALIGNFSFSDLRQGYLSTLQLLSRGQQEHVSSSCCHCQLQRHCSFPRSLSRAGGP